MNESNNSTEKRNFDCDLLLIGHAVEDTIFDGDKEPLTQWGGIYNVARQFKKLSVYRTFCGYKEPKIIIEPTAYGRAYIKIDRKTCSKEVEVDLNLKARRIWGHDIHAMWTHVCYINKLDGWQFTSSGIRSADVCGTGILNSSFMNLLDYVFVSDEDFDVEQESSFAENTIFIAHTPDYVRLWKGGIKEFEYKVPNKLKTCNPLGAGDSFAAGIIHYILFVNDNIEEAVKFAVEKTHDYLLSN